MPTLGNALDFAKLEGKNFRAHQLGSAPASPVTGQLYYDTGTNTLYWWNGSAWISAAGGAASDATASAKGIIQLAGDLGGGGTAAAPVIANGAITSAKILDGTITDVDVAAANKDGVVGTASMRTLGFGAQQAMQGNRSLDQIAAANVMQGNVSIGGTYRITNCNDPVASQDVATKFYVDNLVQGLDAKASVRCATTANISNLAGGAPNTLDGVTLAANDRILVKDQAGPSGNGIYTVTTLGTGSNGTWTRAVDMDTWLEVPNSYVWVEVGTANADTGWVCTADQGGTLGTTAITWSLFASAGTLIAGAGLTKTGNTIDAVATAGGGLLVNPDDIGISPLGVTGPMIANNTIDLTAKVNGNLPVGNGGTGQSTAKAARETGLGSVGYYTNSATHGAGTTITITQATHGLRSTRALHVQVQDNATGNVELPDVSVASNGDVTVTYAASVAANSKLVSIIG